MSSHLSPAQALPTYVLRSILKWVVKERRSPIFGNRYQLDYLRELLIVCSTWRREVLELMWGQLRLGISVKTNTVKLICPSWVKYNRLPANAANLVKEIHVGVTMHGIVSGIAYRLLSDYIGDTKCFPLVNKIHVLLSNYNIQSIDTLDIATARVNALEFAKLLKSMALAATTVALMLTKGQSQRINVIGSVSSDMGEAALTRFANVLYANTNQAILDLNMVGFKHLSTIDHIPLLSFLNLSCMEIPDVSTSLVRKSASVLQYLSVTIRDANKLIYNDNGDNVVYPNLQNLLMGGCIRNHSDTMAMYSDFAPFPVLRSLVLQSPYPFNDDVLFRGNRATLEYLDFILDDDTIVLLHQIRVFESDHKVLHHVSICEDFNNGNTSLVPEATVSMFLRNLLSATNILEVRNPKIARVCIAAAQRSKGFQNVRLFKLRLDSLPVIEVLNLLKVFPALEKIICEINGLGPELENISAEELPDYVETTYGGTGKNLRLWNTGSYTSHHGPRFIEYVLLLALTCPKLHGIENMSRYTRNYHLCIATALASGPYSKYATRLNRIFDLFRS